MDLGLLTGGGDCPGLNAVIRAVVRKGIRLGDSILGIKNGWAGLIHAQATPLTEYAVAGILPKGGTILGTSRTNPFKDEDSIQRSMDNFRKFGLEALIAVGGEDTLGVAQKFSDRGLPIVGIPKTIDNDMPGTDYTFGFDTAINVAVEAIDRLHSTAEAHHRVMVVEVMGRQSGWIAALAGIAGGADYILIPEEPYRIDDVCESLLRRKKSGRDFSIVVVAEGARPEGAAQQITQSDRVDEFGHIQLGGVGSVVAREIERRTGLETRVTTLGHIQRGGSPTAADRVLATRFGVAAVELAHAGRFGRMVGLRGLKIVDVPLEPPGRRRTLEGDFYRDAQVFFG